MLSKCFFFDSVQNQQTANSIKDAGAISFGEALKTNTTLIHLDLECQHKRNNTQMTSINNPLFPFFAQTTDNNIGNAGATSLSEGLKTNTTLTKLDFSCQHKDTKTYTKDIQNHFLFHFVSNKTANEHTMSGIKALKEALMANTTLTQL